MNYILVNRIEELRSQLNKYSIGKSLTDPEVVSMSQRLDLLLNEYYELSASRLLPDN